MCGVFGLSKNSLDSRYMSKWNVGKYLDWSDRYNIRPTQAAPVIVTDENGQNNRELVRFGLVPSWSKVEQLKFSAINAKAETINALPTYKKPFQEKRCLVVADFFFEFEKSPEGSQPYFFKLKEEGPMVFAAVYDVNTQTGVKPIISFAIVTVPA